MTVYLSVCLSVYLNICLFVYLNLSRPDVRIEGAVLNEDSFIRIAALPRSLARSATLSRSMVLSFHKLLSAELLEEDGLVVMGSGLGLEGIVERFIKAYSSSHSIVLAINIPTVLQEQYRQNLAFQGVQTLPRIINNETTSSDRTQLYLQGGVLFISPWILVLDLLRKRIPTHLVSGILVFNAHRLEEFCTEDFILKLYRQSNKVSSSRSSLARSRAACTCVHISVVSIRSRALDWFHQGLL